MSFVTATELAEQFISTFIPHLCATEGVDGTLTVSPNGSHAQFVAASSFNCLLSRGTLKDHITSHNGIIIGPSSLTGWVLRDIKQCVVLLDDSLEAPENEQASARIRSGAQDLLTFKVFNTSSISFEKYTPSKIWG
jgi:hypothetical protein